MSHQPLREDKTCLNCRSVVEKTYCPNCGQKNTESRQSFTHLFTHFFEDFTHYDNAFWRTMSALLFKPARLTKEYLAGKRQKYVPPVRLYIFISFVTFLVVGMRMSAERKDIDVKSMSKVQLDSIQALNSSFNIGGHKSVRELDSIQKTRRPEERTSGFEYDFEKGLARFNEKYKDRPQDKIPDFMKGFIHTLPKVLFIYMPIFALLLWLFHNKKKWYYFEHGIFTLHYFSFILLTLIAYLALGATIGGFAFWENITGWILTALLGWWFFYFFRSHSRFYGEPKWISRLKSFALFLVNGVLIFVFIIAIFFYTAINL